MKPSSSASFLSEVVGVAVVVGAFVDEPGVDEVSEGTFVSGSVILSEVFGWESEPAGVELVIGLVVSAKTAAVSVKSRQTRRKTVKKRTLTGLDMT